MEALEALCFIVFDVLQGLCSQTSESTTPRISLLVYHRRLSITSPYGTIPVTPRLCTAMVLSLRHPAGVEAARDYVTQTDWLKSCDLVV